MKTYRSPRSHDELHSFVANFGALCARSTARCRLEDVVLRAVAASRRDPSLARLLPVFLYRVRADLDLDELAAGAARRRCTRPLGYYLDVADLVAPTRSFQETTEKLRRNVCTSHPVFLFPETARYPLEALDARRNTPHHARSWGLLVRTSLDSYRSYFAKVAHL